MAGGNSGLETVRHRDSGSGYQHEDTRICTGYRLTEGRSHLNARSYQDTQTSPYLALSARGKKEIQRSSWESPWTDVSRSVPIPSVQHLGWKELLYFWADCSLTQEDPVVSCDICTRS